MTVKKLLTWKAIFLLVLFLLGILIGFSINRTRMQLIQNDKGNNIVIDDITECCSFMGVDGNLKTCKAISTYGCDECETFCEGRKGLKEENS